MKKVFTEKELPKIAREILAIFMEHGTRNIEHKSATIVALSGELGAGKTSLTQAIAKDLGIQGKVVSPTFVLMKFYPLPQKRSTLRVPRYVTLVHIDAYRLETAKELEKLGWKELVANPENLIIIEWPERVKKLIPRHALKVYLKHKGIHRSIKY